ncbi:hypothetical protein FOA52_009301 [Chlamydomonas sp. UWO 241]|nr:hypothetical protein FOA52_009301 [Chlamydomonas sp. UWO 241]
MTGALRIAAADALAAAVSAGDNSQGPVKRKPQGKALSGDVEVFDIDARGSGPQPQLQVAPITVVKTDYRLQVQHTIAVNSVYICYALKTGHVRALNKDTAARTLLKDHTCAVADMCFFGNWSNLLASVDVGGEVVVRKIFEDDSGGGDEASTIRHEVLVRHIVGASPAATRHLVWHPFLDSLLAVVAGDRAALVQVPPTSGVASSPEFASPVIPTGAMTEGPITAAAFVDRGDMLAACDTRGFVYVWAIDADVQAAWASGSVLQPLGCEPDVKFRAFDEPDSATTLEFLPSRPGMGTQQATLVVGNKNCRVLKLWSVDIESQPVRACTLELASSKGGPDSFFCHMLVQPAFDAVVLADTAHKQVYVVHVRDDGSAPPRFDYISDYAVMQPILSLTTTVEPTLEDGSDVFHLFTVQTEGIQQYTLFPDACLPPRADGAASAAAAAPGADAGQRRQVELMAQTVAEVVGSSVARDTAQASAAPPPAAAASSANGGGAAAAAPVVVAAVVFAAPAAAAAAAAAPAPAPSSAPSEQGSGFADDSSDRAASVALATDGKGSLRSIPSTPSAHQPLAQSPPRQQQQQQHKQPSRTASAASSASASAFPPPPPPAFLVKKMADANAAAASQSNSAAAAAAQQQQDAGGSSSAGGGGAPSSAAPATDDGVAAAAASAAATAAVSAPQGAGPQSSCGGGGGGDGGGDTAAILKLLRNMDQAQREAGKATAKAAKAAAVAQEAAAKAQATASEAAMKTALDAALKAFGKSQDEARARESKLVLQSVTAVLTGVSKEVSGLKESVAALAKSMAQQQSAGPSVTRQTVAESLPRAVADAFAASVIPSFERAVGAMFAQIDASFSASMTLQTELSNTLRDSLRSLNTAATSLSVSAAAGVSSGGASTARSGAISLAELEGRAAAAAAPRDPKDVIQGHLAASDYESAFMTALSTGAPDTTMWLCKQLKPGDVFDADPCPLSQVCVCVCECVCKQLKPGDMFDADPCPLSQEVLLSLVTHLSHQLGVSDTETKLSWLVDAAPCIEPRHPRVQEHCRQVLEPIKAQLTTLARSLSGEQARTAKTAVHLVNSLLHQ